MNRFECIEIRFHPSENHVRRDSGVRLYDGDNKVHEIN